MSINASLLRRFCAGPSDFRVFFHQPWRRGDFVYASNGALIVRVSAKGRRIKEAPEGKDPANIPALFDAAPTAGFVPVPATVFEPPKCGTCNGSGKHRYRRCLDCEGVGKFEHGEHWYDCRTCDASGLLFDEAGDHEINCPDCKGTGIDDIVGDPRVVIGPAEFSTKYIALLGELPNCEIAVNAADKAAAFRFDGGDGLLMPMRPQR